MLNRRKLYRGHIRSVTGVVEGLEGYNCVVRLMILGLTTPETSFYVNFNYNNYNLSLLNILLCVIKICQLMGT